MREDMDKRLNTMKDSEIIKRLFKYGKPYIKTYLIVIALLTIVEVLIVVEPILIGETIDLIVTDYELARLFTLLGSMLAIIVVSNIVGYYQTISLQKMGQSIIYDIRKEIFSFLENHDIAYLNSTPTGALTTRVTNDTSTLNEMFTSVFINILRSSIKLILIIIFMFALNWQLTLYALVIIPIVAVLSYFFRKLSRRIYRQMRAQLSRVNAFLAEHLSGMKIIQIFNQEESKFEEFNEKNKKLRNSYYKQVFVFGVYRPSMYLVYMLTVLVIFYFGGISVLDNIITIGVLFTFYIYVGRFFEPIQNLAEQFNVLQSAFASSERIFGILDSEPTILDKEDAVELTEMKGNIEFKDVWFKYVEDEWVLKGVSFKVNAKESVAFVGATGSGKTTILSLIVRNYDIQSGQILIDGIDIKDIKKASLRKFVGQMLQDVFMFSGTIESNIKLRSEEITHEEMVEACKYVNAHNFISKLDNGYQEEVRERGNNFSSGQRQLVSFARTIVHKPSVMILDEATSNIDTETEQLIQESLEKMMSIGTMLIVAHRLSTIQNCDRIIVLSKGEILEQGNHQELLKNRGHYFNLYKLQYQDQQKNDNN